MNNGTVLFLDSGVGGIPYAKDFITRNPHETIYYLADRENFPYGPRKKEEIADILISLTEKLQKQADPKIVVVACNTASIAALEPLRKNFPGLPFVGTVPALKPAALACKSGKIGVLATERTITDIYSLNLEDGGCEIIAYAAPELVEFVEQNFESAGEKEKAEIVKIYVDLFRAEGADTLVLGCTHFLYLIDEFKREAEPSIKIFDSVEGITKRTEFLLDENSGALRAGKEKKTNNRLLLTGTQPPCTFWKNRADALGFDLYLLNEKI